jgi:hypothetical protein
MASVDLPLKIEAFTAIAATSLSVGSTRINDLVTKAFKMMFK